MIAHELELNASNALELLRQYDCVLDGSDRLSTRYLVNDACVLLQRPLVSAAIHRFEGQALTYLPGRGPCYRCLFPQADAGVAPSCAEAGVLGVLPGVLGALQATEAIKLILGLGAPLVGRLLTYDALGHAMAGISLRAARGLRRVRYSAHDPDACRHGGRGCRAGPRPVPWAAAAAIECVAGRCQARRRRPHGGGRT